VYDELFIFNMKNLDKETFADGLLRISCYDANSLPFAGTFIVFFCSTVCKRMITVVIVRLREHT